MMPKDNNNKENKEVVQHTITQVSVRSGFLPTPEEMEYYENVLNGSAEKLLNTAIDQIHHNQKMEHKIIDTEAVARLLGLVLAFIVCVISLAIVAYAIKENNVTLGLTTLLATAITSAIAFIGSKPKNNHKE